MAISATTLDTFPPHIIQSIASYAGEGAIWRMMATCRNLRQPAEIALRPHLAARTVTPYPVLVPDVYKPIDPELAQNHLIRKAELDRVSRLFESHLAAYPPSASNLRQLTLEVRDDDDISSWAHIKRFAGQLERLDIHIYDRFWRVSVADEWDELDEPPISTDTPMDRFFNSSVWYRVIETDFPSLDSLTLCATNHIGDHFQALAPKLLGLRELTLSCHWMASHDDDINYTLPLFDNLERFTVIGHQLAICNLLFDIIYLFHKLRHLSISLSNYESDSFSDNYLDGVIDPIVQANLQELRALAIYGPSVYQLLEAICRSQLKVYDDDSCAFDGTTILVLEQTRILNGQRAYPLLWEEDNRPAFPSLQNLTFVLDQRNPTTESDEPFYNPIALKSLFLEYPSLHTVEWVTQYPDIDRHAYPTIWSESNIRCSVHRVDNGKDQTQAEDIELEDLGYPIPAEHIEAWVRDLARAHDLAAEEETESNLYIYFATISSRYNTGAIRAIKQEVKATPLDEATKIEKEEIQHTVNTHTPRFDPLCLPLPHLKRSSSTSSLAQDSRTSTVWADRNGRKGSKRVKKEKDVQKEENMVAGLMFGQQTVKKEKHVKEETLEHGEGKAEVKGEEGGGVVKKEKEEESVLGGIKEEEQYGSAMQLESSSSTHYDSPQEVRMPWTVRNVVRRDSSDLTPPPDLPTIARGQQTNPRTKARRKMGPLMGRTEDGTGYPPTERRIVRAREVQARRAARGEALEQKERDRAGAEHGEEHDG